MLIEKRGMCYSANNCNQSAQTVLLIGQKTYGLGLPRSLGICRDDSRSAVAGDAGVRSVGHVVTRGTAGPRRDQGVYIGQKVASR